MHRTCVNKNATTFTIFFLKNRRKILVRIYIDLIDMNNIFRWIFALCNLDFLVQKLQQILWSSFESPWSGYEGTWLSVHQQLIDSYSSLLRQSPFCKIFFYCMTLGCKVRPSVVIWLNDDELILCKLLHLAIIICLLAGRGVWSQCLHVFKHFMVFHNVSDPVKAGTSLDPHYCAAIWGPLVLKLWSKLINKYCKTNTSEEVNNFVHWKCGLFPIIFINKLFDLLHSKWSEGIEQNDYQQWSVRFKVDNDYLTPLMLLLVM